MTGNSDIPNPSFVANVANFVPANAGMIAESMLLPRKNGIFNFNKKRLRWNNLNLPDLGKI